MRVTQMIDENTFSTKSLIHLTLRAIFTAKPFYPPISVILHYL